MQTKNGLPYIMINPQSQAMQGGTAAQNQNVRFPGTEPALTNINPNQSNNQGILSNPGSGRRSNTQLAVQRPDLGISTNEMLMRVGGAGMRGAQTSGLESYANMMDTYGGIQDQRRSNSVSQYDMEYDAQQDELARQAELEKARLKVEKDQPGMPQQSPYTKATMDAISQIEASVAKGASGSWFNVFDNVTGLWGAGLSLIPGTPAYDTKMQIETVVSSIGFDRLQKMRDESPTGGALGQVSERELSQLNASLGNLRQSQSRDSFLRNLAQVKKHYMSTVEAIREQQIDYAKKNGLPVPATAGAGTSAAPANVGQSTQIGGVTVTRIK